MIKYRKINIYRIVLLVGLVVGSCFILIRKSKLYYYENSGKIFGTVYHIKYESERDLHDSILSELNDVDASLSVFNDSSIISKVNRNEDVALNKDFREVFLLSQQVSSATEGAFDITVAPLVNVWGFGFKHSSSVSKNKIDSIRSIVGYEKVSIENGIINKQNPLVMLDCSAIAKGYGVDKIARMFERVGIKNYMIEIGGEIAVRGYNDLHKLWKIGIEKPVDNKNVTADLQTVLPITNCALATSGNYRNFYYKDGKKFAHTIDPKTGYPVQHSLLSASVIAPTCAEADAYATAFMVMGVEKSKQLLSKKKTLKAYLIYADSLGQYKVWTNIRDLK